jgi:hypothetical protein
MWLSCSIRLRGAQHIRDLQTAGLGEQILGRDWWTRGIHGRGRGLVLLLADPREIEAMALEVAATLGAETQRLGDLPHCWMANAPDRVADVLTRFWSSGSGPAI